MNLIECDSLPVVLNRLYGGATGSKIAVRYSNRVWLLKSCERLHDKGFRNVDLSYANDPITEYLGSHVYAIFGFPVHDTLLGMYHDRICVLCSDDAYPEPLFEFRYFRNAIFDDGVIQPSSGMSTAISDIMQVVELSNRFSKEDALKRFWQMFVIDSLIGNTDRNNGNWAFVYNDNAFELYEVYDCGGCLNNKRSDQQMQHDLEINSLENLALNYTFNFKDENGKRINPFHYMKRHCNNTILQTLDLLANDKLVEINNLVDSLKPIISDVRASWYKELLKIRFEYLQQLRSEMQNVQPNKITI